MSAMDEIESIDAMEVTSNKPNTEMSTKRPKLSTKNVKKEGMKNQGSSQVWEHVNRHMVDGKYVGTCDCLYYGRKFNTPSNQGTTLLWNHLKKCNKFPASEIDDKQTILSFAGTQQKNWKFDQQVARKALARMIILCELPFSFVEKEGFRLFVQELNPKFHINCRATMTKDCWEIYIEERENLKEYFKKFCARVSLTTDLWTSIQNLGYMCVTAHYVDINWKLQKKIINFRVLPHPHKGEAISKALESCLLGWGLDKLTSITLDNAKNNDKCVEDLKKRFNKKGGLLLGGEFFHVRCFAHIINLVVRDGLKDIKDTIKRLRRSVKYVRSSPSRLQLFKTCALEERITSKKGLCLDVKTRWNSTYLMISAAMQYQKAFERLEEQDESYKVEVNTKGVGLIQESDWKTLKALHTFLEEFYLLTKRVSGSQYLTSNSYFDEVTSTKDLLLEYEDSDDPFFRDMALSMNAKFDKYCDIEHLNLIMVVALVLDPRHKLQYVEYWYAEFYAKDRTLSQDQQENKVIDFIESLKVVMSRLYYHYKMENDSFMDIDSSKGPFGDGDKVSNSIENVDKRSLKKKGFSNYLKRKENVELMNDLDRYLLDGIEALDDPTFDLLAWWRGKIPTYHALAMMARDILAIPLTSVASESAFSTSKRVLDQFRSSLTPRSVECLVCTQDWIRSSPKMDIEDTLEFFENIEDAVMGDFHALSLGS